MKKARRIIFSVIGLLLGFITPVVAQYGAPSVVYRVVGKTINQNGDILPAREVQIEQKYLNQPLQIISGENGEFQLIGLRRLNEINFISEGNDSYRWLDTVIHWNDVKWETESKDYWEREYIGNIELVFTEDKKEQEPETKLSVQSPESNHTNTFSDLPLDEISQLHDLLVYPNPNRGFFSYRINSVLDTEADIFITDLSARVIYKEKILLVKGNNVFSFNALQLSKGSYLLNLIVNQRILSRQIIVY